MERLFHISTTPKYMNWFDNDWSQVKAFAKKHCMEGIELGLTLDYPIETIEKDIVKGVHLSFYPMWLDFWRGDMKKVESLLGSEEAIRQYYGGLSREVLVDSYKKQFERAKALEAEYMVFHVCHICPEDSFTWTFDYTDEEVIDATIELVNEVFKGEEGPKLLFENLWWPGLTYTKPEAVKRLLQGIQYPHKGLLVDISHLILMNEQVGTEKAAYHFIKDVVSGLGELKQYIEGVHLNKTLPKIYRKRDYSYLLERYRAEKEPMQKTRVLKQHIQKLDPHEPFDHPVAQDLLKLINPKYCVYETNPETIYEMAYFIKRQNKALGIEY